MLLCVKTCYNMLHGSMTIPLTPLAAAHGQGVSRCAPGTVAGSSRDAVRCRCMVKDEMRTPQAKSPSGPSMRYADRARSIALGLASSSTSTAVLPSAHHGHIRLVMTDRRSTLA
jgi:hypothetical protein